MKTFYHLLGNTLAASFTNFTVWFAITFFLYLETESVFAIGILSGIYLTLAAVSGFWFGSLVDHHKKKIVMLASSFASLLAFAIAFSLYITVAPDTFKDVGNPLLWVFILLLVVGVVVGNIRSIALSTLVTLIIPEDRRDKANGMVGTVTGITFLTVSFVSGILVGHSGMFLVLLGAMIFTVLLIAHLIALKIPGDTITHLTDAPQRVDIRGTLKVIRGIPGLLPLIVFTTLNNFLGGIFMSLMDAYGLSMVSVQTWGFLWGALSVGMILSGIAVAKFGLGRNPLRVLFIVNIISWSVSSVFTIYASIIPLAIGIFVWLFVSPIAEAAEQTVLQKVVPHERQGRVFGFAQSIEQAASPLMAFLIGPLTQFVFIPFMTDGAGASLIGSWFGTGQARGIALVFTIAGIVGLLLTIFAMSSRYYRQLSHSYQQG